MNRSPRLGWFYALASVALTVPVCAVCAQSLEAPVFRGALGMGNRATALFELPGGAGSWQGVPGATVPGTSWRIDRVTLNPSQVSVTVGKKPVLLTPGTFVAGDRAATAADVARPPNVPIGELKPPDPAEVARRRQASLLARQRAERPASAQPEQPPPSNAGLVDTVDISKEVLPVESFAKKGYSTAVMVTSPACHVCRAARPAVALLPTRKARSRVVFADVGVDAHGGINTTAPFLAVHKITALPYFFLLDETGAIGAQGESAWKIVRQLAPW